MASCIECNGDRGWWSAHKGKGSSWTPCPECGYENGKEVAPTYPNPWERKEEEPKPKKTTITLDTVLIDELANNIRNSLLHHHEPSDREADYICVFCYRRARTNGEQVVHESDCVGVQFLKAYDEATKDD